MSRNTTREMLIKMREGSVRRGRLGRGMLIDEVCEMCGYGRKHAIKVPGGKLPVAGAEKARRGGPRRRSGDAERQVLKVIGMATVPEAAQSVGGALAAAFRSRAGHLGSGASRSGAFPERGDDGPALGPVPGGVGESPAVWQLSRFAAAQDGARAHRALGRGRPWLD